MGLRNDMEVLMESIKQPILFFIPSQRYEQLSDKELINLEKIGFLNTLFITNSSGDTKPITKGTELLQILEKSKIFKANVFQLLELKSTLDKDAFHYLIDDYFKELSSWITATDIVQEEAKNRVINYKPEMQEYLKLQHEVLVAHQLELNKHFGKWKSHFEIRRILNISDNNSFNGDKSTNVTLPIKQKPTQLKIDKPTKSAKPKTKAISTNEVDQHLLKSVFNVDFNRINNE
ncbi:hypothetical protein [Winogradskyella sp. PE311]|uniref:hypothetical protein n=1 Tax=Winogradskyella sp. PE311 TaxID=3366943 RepID=UPI00397F6F28